MVPNFIVIVKNKTNESRRVIFEAQKYNEVKEFLAEHLENFIEYEVQILQVQLIKTYNKK